MEAVEFKKIELGGRYQYIGFLLEKTDTLIRGKEDEIISKTLGVQLIFFKDNEDKIVYVRNTDIKDASTETPYGTFQPFLSEFTRFLDISVSKKGEYDFK